MERWVPELGKVLTNWYLAEREEAGLVMTKQHHVIYTLPLQFASEAQTKDMRAVFAPQARPKCDSS